MFCDARWAEIFGVDLATSALTAQTYDERIHPEDKARASEVRNAGLESGTDFQMTYRIVTPAGVVKWVACVGHPVKNPTGAVVRIVGVVADVTETRETQRHLEALHDAHRRAEKLARVGSWTWHIAEDRFVWSETLYELNGWDPSASAPNFEGLRQVLTPESFERASAVVAKCLKDGLPYSVEFTGVRRDGTQFPATARGEVVRDVGGNIVSLAGTVQDDTGRRDQERALRESEARWQFALDGAGEGVWDWDVKAGRVFFSHQWKAMLGYSDDDVGNTVKDWEDRVHPDDLRHCWEEIQRHFAGDTATYVSEHRMRAKDGTWCWILDRGRIVERDVEGQPLRVIGTHTDITERKLAEQSIQLLHERMGLAVSAGGVGIWEVDFKSGAYLYNEQMHVIYAVGESGFRHDVPCGVFGGTLEQWLAVIPPEDVPQVLAVLEGGKYGSGIIEFEHRIIRPGGEIRHVRSAARIIQDAAGNPVRGIGTTLDVTEHRLLTRALSNEKERVLLATKVGGIGIWELDFTDGNFIWDDQMHELYGLKPGEFNCSLSQWVSLIHAEDTGKVLDDWQEAISVTSIFRGEFRIAHPSGEFRWMRALAQVFRSEEGAPQRALGTNWDVTKERQAAEAMKQAKEAAEAAERAKSDFMASISH
ncbi:MAG TPA: PAS domain-containing protein, partial [Verrucomicrobium sp.]|nr:PAS domain-containing protein [Verrucomicrobium sp.]